MFNVFLPPVHYFSNIVYIGLKPQAMNLLRAANPKVRIRFPIRDESATSTAASKSSKKSSPSSSGPGWISTKKAPATKKPPRKKSTKPKTKKKTSKKTLVEKKKTTKTKTKTAQKTKASPEVIEMLDDSDDNDDDSSEGFVMPKKTCRERNRNSIQLDDLESSDSDC